jgi:uncharacterized protein YndB with AHSA1/START domain
VRRLEFDVHIEAPRERVWHTMLDEVSYRQWSAAFAAGSHYVGDWSEGNLIRFVAPGPGGKDSGVICRVTELRPYERVTMTTAGLIENGVEDTGSEALRAWDGAIEQYTFRDAGQGTDLHVTVDTIDAWFGMMERVWNGALPRLKTLAERG